MAPADDARERPGFRMALALARLLQRLAKPSERRRCCRTPGLGLAGQGVRVNKLQPQGGVLSPLCVLYLVSMSGWVLEGGSKPSCLSWGIRKKNPPVTEPCPFMNSYTPPRQDRKAHAHVHACDFKGRRESKM